MLEAEDKEWGIKVKSLVKKQNQLSDKIKCLNASDLTLEIALSNLADIQNGNFSSALGKCYLTLTLLVLM